MAIAVAVLELVVVVVAVVVVAVAVAVAVAVTVAVVIVVVVVVVVVGVVVVAQQGCKQSCNHGSKLVCEQVGKGNMTKIAKIAWQFCSALPDQDDPNCPNGSTKYLF